MWIFYTRRDEDAQTAALHQAVFALGESHGLMTHVDAVL